MPWADLQSLVDGLSALTPPKRQKLLLLLKNNDVDEVQELQLMHQNGKLHLLHLSGLFQSVLETELDAAAARDHDHDGASAPADSNGASAPADSDGASADSDQQASATSAAAADAEQPAVNSASDTAADSAADSTLQPDGRMDHAAELSEADGDSYQQNPTADIPATDAPATDAPATDAPADCAPAADSAGVEQCGSAAVDHRTDHRTDEQSRLVAPDIDFAQRDRALGVLLCQIRDKMGHFFWKQGQEEATKSILRGHDTCAWLQTGGGKSLIYMVATKALDVHHSRGGDGALSIVISPLIALIHDQVRQVNSGTHSHQLVAAALGGGMTQAAESDVIAKVVSGKVHLLFVSPEKVSAGNFKMLKNEKLARRIKLVVVDECHCAVQVILCFV